MLMSMHIALVTSISDDEKAGRIRASLLELGNEEYPAPFDPIMPPGFHLLPKVGDQVAVFLPGGDDLTTFPEYAFWLATVHDRDSAPVPDEFKDAYEKQTGYKTPDGLLLFFDDDAKVLKLQTPGGHVVTLQDGATAASAGTIKVEHSSGASIEVDSGGAITVKAKAGGSVLLKDATGALIDKLTKKTFDFDPHTHVVPMVGTSGPPSTAGIGGTTVVQGQ